MAKACVEHQIPDHQVRTARATRKAAIRANLPWLVVIAGLFALAMYVPGIVSPAIGQIGEDLEESSARIGWTPAIDAHGVAADIARRVNDERAERGLPPLLWDEGLADLARQWSEEMIATGFRHSPDSFRVLPGMQGIGENIAMGQTDSGEMNVGWMESDGHRRNILTPEYSSIGVGVVCRNDGRMWGTQLFGVPTGAHSSGPYALPPVEPVVRRDTGKTC